MKWFNRNENIFYIIIVCVFWMIFGGSKKGYDKFIILEVNGYGNFGDVFYSLFRLTLVDEYDFEVRFIIGRFIYVLKRMIGREKK